MTTSVLAAKAAVPPADVMNGPEDARLDWSSIGWRQVEDDVRRLRQRIFTAAKEQDLRRVRSLQKLMLGSRSNALWSVRRVTEVNTGRKTAGVDGLIVVSSSQKADPPHNHPCPTTPASGQRSRSDPNEANANCGGPALDGDARRLQLRIDPDI